MRRTMPGVLVAAATVLVLPGCDECLRDAASGRHQLTQGAVATSRFSCTTECHSFVEVEWATPTSAVDIPIQVSVGGYCINGQTFAPFTATGTTSPIRVEDFNVKNVCGDGVVVSYAVQVRNPSSSFIGDVQVFMRCPDGSFGGTI